MAAYKRKRRVINMDGENIQQARDLESSRNANQNNCLPHRIMEKNDTEYRRSNHWKFLQASIETYGRLLQDRGRRRRRLQKKTYHRMERRANGEKKKGKSRTGPLVITNGRENTSEKLNTYCECVLCSFAYFVGLDVHLLKSRICS
jgi:hypothetical protein